jgi:type I restriction-modification system DNA methylase subunit
MNMILHNISNFTIENGDTLEDPQILEPGFDSAQPAHPARSQPAHPARSLSEAEGNGAELALSGAELALSGAELALSGAELALSGAEGRGRIRKFDRVLANPPFSQNYTRASMSFTHRFREWCPEAGKKADLMFAQHMLASLKPDGRMATIMPHGVLFRGGKEKLIRELFIEDDVIEAIISLPPGLFYGTGIPACVLVCNKSKPDELRDKVLFINADREFAEGKNQNKLRPEDIEKIDDLKYSTTDSAKRELKALQAQDKAIKALEKRIKDNKASLKVKSDELALKLQLKRLGGDEFKAETHELIAQIDGQLAKLDPAIKGDKREINALDKDKSALKTRLAKTDSLLQAIGGQLTEEEARRLILAKLYDIANAELNRYLNTEKRALIAVVENLWDKYAVSSRDLEQARGETLQVLDGFLEGLGYLGDHP